MQQKLSPARAAIKPEQRSCASLEQVLDLLACPACLNPLRPAPSTLTCTACSRVYPVLDGIPVLLIDRATPPL